MKLLMKRVITFLAKASGMTKNKSLKTDVRKDVGLFSRPSQDL